MLIHQVLREFLLNDCEVRKLDPIREQKKQKKESRNDSPGLCTKNGTLR